MKDSIAEIQRLVLNRTDSNQRKLNGIWPIDYFATPTQNQAFDLRLIITHTLGQGCAYSEIKNQDRNTFKRLLGRDVLEEEIEFAIRVSILDSLYGVLYPFSKKETKINNENPDIKNLWRSHIVLSEAQRLIGKSQFSKPMRVLNIGFVDSFVRTLREAKYEVFATDLESSIIGAEISGVTIEDGVKSHIILRNVDLVIATGMTITTNTIDRIIKECKKNNTKLLIFAETGHSFASYYLQNGVDTYISEHFPFYSFEGYSIIDICRGR